MPTIPRPSKGRVSVSHFKQLSFQIRGENMAAGITRHCLHQRHRFELSEAADWAGVNILITELVAVVV
jgi:hypothetical protein